MAVVGKDEKGVERSNSPDAYLFTDFEIRKETSELIVSVSANTLGTHSDAFLT